jgi:hypothetical protein
MEISRIMTCPNNDLFRNYSLQSVPLADISDINANSIYFKLRRILCIYCLFSDLEQHCDETPLFLNAL